MTSETFEMDRKFYELGIEHTKAMLEEFGEQIEIIPQTVEAVHTHTHTRKY